MQGTKERLDQLFGVLKSVDYDWQPKTPDTLRKMRDGPQYFSQLTRFFGMGLPLIRDELLAEGLMEKEIQIVESSSSIFGDRLSIARMEEVFVPYHHFNLNSSKPDYVYCGYESLVLTEFLKENFPVWRDSKKILDLGSSSGLLSAFLIQWLEDPEARIQAVDINPTAVVFGEKSFQAQGFENVEFLLGEAGDPLMEKNINKNSDLIIFNPPMVIPDKKSFKVYRDSADMGTEVPLSFLDCAEKVLDKKGHVFCLATNPVIRGQDFFFQKLKKKSWKIQNRKCLNPFFNQSVAKERGYPELGIERIELWALHLQL